MVNGGKKVIYFDWGGTLASKDVSQKANVRRTKFFESNLDENEIVALQHNNNNDHYAFVMEVISKHLGISNSKSIRTFQAVFFGYFYIEVLKEMGSDALLFDPEKFKEFKKKNNLRFVIVTSLWEGIIKSCIEILKLDDVFDDVFSCSSDLAETKNENLKRAIKSSSEFIPWMMIGDRGEDVDAGIAHNLKTVFCNYGHGNVNNADCIACDFLELLDAIERSL